METIDNNTITGLGALFDNFMSIEYPHIDTHTRAYHYMQGAIKALEQIDMPEEQRQKILMGMAMDKKSELEGWEYVNIVCGDIFHV